MPSSTIIDGTIQLGHFLWFRWVIDNKCVGTSFWATLVVTTWGIDLVCSLDEALCGVEDAGGGSEGVWGGRNSQVEDTGSPREICWPAGGQDVVCTGTEVGVDSKRLCTTVFKPINTKDFLLQTILYVLFLSYSDFSLLTSNFSWGTKVSSISQGSWVSLASLGTGDEGLLPSNLASQVAIEVGLSTSSCSRSRSGVSRHWIWAGELDTPRELRQGDNVGPAGQWIAFKWDSMADIGSEVADLDLAGLVVKASAFVSVPGRVNQWHSLKAVLILIRFPHFFITSPRNEDS